MKIGCYSFCYVLALVVVVCSNGSAFAYTGSHTKVAIKDGRWVINGEWAHPDSPAEGLLMNVRMVNAVFENTGPAARSHLPGFDPDENTDNFIRQIPDYAAHGVRAFTISLQGGFPGYEGAVNSAFSADGGLRDAYMARVTRVIRAADRHGVVIVLSCFYQRQHSHKRMLEGRKAIRDAVANVAAWIVNRGFTNVVLEISNEYAHSGFSRWQDGEWLRSVAGQIELIQHAKSVAPDLLVSTSGMGNGTIAREIAEAADFVLIHFNNTRVEDIPRRIEEARRYGKPVVCNEDDKVGQAGAEAARLSVEHGAGWGFMHNQKNQYVPFEFDGAGDDPLVYQMLTRLTAPRRRSGIPTRHHDPCPGNPSRDRQPPRPGKCASANSPL